MSLSSRYITDRFLPDKAIDVVDEAASKVRMQVFSTAPDVKALEERLKVVKTRKKQPLHPKTLKRLLNYAMKRKL